MSISNMRADMCIQSRSVSDAIGAHWIGPYADGALKLAAQALQGWGHHGLISRGQPQGHRAKRPQPALHQGQIALDSLRGSTAQMSHQRHGASEILNQIDDNTNTQCRKWIDGKRSHTAIELGVQCIPRHAGGGGKTLLVTQTRCSYMGD